MLEVRFHGPVKSFIKLVTNTDAHILAIFKNSIILNCIIFCRLKEAIKKKQWGLIKWNLTTPMRKQPMLCVTRQRQVTYTSFLCIAHLNFEYWFDQ